MAQRFSLDAFLRPKMDFRDLDLVFYRLEQHPNFTTLIPGIELSLNGCFSLQLVPTDYYNRSRGAVRLPQNGAPASCTRLPPYYVALLCVLALHAECGGLVQPVMTGHTSTTLLELSLSFAPKGSSPRSRCCFLPPGTALLNFLLVLGVCPVTALKHSIRKSRTPNLVSKAKSMLRTRAAEIRPTEILRQKPQDSIPVFY